jgi:signal transduction histidine kinase
MLGFPPGFVPDGAAARGERYGGRILFGIGLAALTVCTVIEGASGTNPPARWHVTLAIAVATGLWLLTLPWLYPRRARYPALTVVFYLVLLLGSTVLATRSEIYTAFVSVGYPMAFGLFSARWSVFAVAANAIVPLLAQTGFGTSTRSPVWVLLVSVAGPLLYAAWFVGAESERRRRANAELARANEKLEQALEENASLHAQLLGRAREAGVHDERQRMAREIHDTLAQGLTGIITQLQAADRAKADPGQRERHLAHVQSLARDSLSEARRSVDALRPEPLAHTRLPEALAELGRTFEETSGVAVRVETTGETRPLLPELEVALYRIAQEALANAGKHAKAGRVGLTLSYVDDVVLLDVRDDGVGFTPGDRPAKSAAGNGFGLQAMRQRVQRVAGTLAVESTPGEGTAISAQVPAIPADGDTR